MPLSRFHVVVLGGGISGLAAAHRLVELAPSARITLLEAGPRLGGVLQTDRRNGFLVERSADNFITNVPWGIDLCRRVGLGDELLGTDAARRKAYVVCRGKLEAVPEGFVLMSPGRMWPLVASPILSLFGKLRLAWEYFVSPRAERDDESLASFARRRFGDEVYERLVQPLVGGIYTADPEKLSMAAALPRFAAMEREHGSLIRAMQQKSADDAEHAHTSGARYGMFVAPRDGMDSLIGALAMRLPAGAIYLNHPATGLARLPNGGWRVESSGATREFAADAVIVALPAPRAAELVSETSAELRAELAAIPYAGTSIVVSAYRRSQVTHPLDGFGFVVPAVEGRRILAASFSSLKFPGRAPDDCVLVRTFVGGALQPDLAQLPDAPLKRLVAEELAGLIGSQGEPLWSEVYRWPAAMPQYHVGHVERVARIRALAAALPGLELCGNAYDGVGVPTCIHGAEEAAARVIAFLNRDPSGAPVTNA